LKPVLSLQKLRGGYYTPQPIADFLAGWAIQSPDTEVLEPSCGDGALLEAALKSLCAKGIEPQQAANLLHGVEIDAGEGQKALARLQTYKLNGASLIRTGDFFAYCRTHLTQRRLFDAVIGNPPFIRYQNFPEEQRANAFLLMRQAGLHPNRLTNSWVPFLVASSLLLREKGRLAMVIPAELLQVNYAAELRHFLSEYYSCLTLITFRKLVFAGIQQEVVLLLGEKNGHEKTGIRTIELNGIEDLAAYQQQTPPTSPLKPLDHSAEKWTKYFLAPEEILLLRELRQHPALTKSGDAIDVDVGIVTGQNDFFVLNDQQAEALALKPLTHRIVSRSAHLKGVIFSGDDWQRNVAQGFPVHLLNLPDAPFPELPMPARAYVTQGETQALHQGYKCRIRRRWYVVPSLWTPPAFMLRQVHLYPKIILNEAAATCTDTIHRVRWRNSMNGKTVAAAFLNSLTFAFAEVTGRSYGGGVLELEPNEAERLPLPLQNGEQLDLSQIHQLLLHEDINAVLDITDQTLLRDGLGLSEGQVKQLRGIWHKLRDRRINRKHKR
jgi:adenine-specific DNA-methyltransferase